jgi:Domain of unknown function (DUF1611_C) P-loop domain
MRLITRTEPSPALDLRLAAEDLRQRLARAKRAYSARHLALDGVAGLTAAEQAPRPGDVVLARVQAIGQHANLELATGRRAQLHVGDEIVVCYGSRYAPDQFEALIPGDLGPCDLVAGGGLASRMHGRHAKMKPPTAILPLGLLCDAAGKVLNLSRTGLAARTLPASRPPVVAVLGTSMNSGKTTTCQSLVRGCVQRGLRVAAAKVTGTGSGGDRWSVVDAGASPVLDFTDAGVPSTFGLAAPHVESIFQTLLATLADAAPDVIVLEIADGLLQRETAALVQSPLFREAVDAVVFAAGEAMGAIAGLDRLRALDLPVVAVSGLITASPLAAREAAAAIDVPVVPIGEIASGVWLPGTVTIALEQRARKAA